MSTTIDQRVVEMKFDNQDFERNTRQTMSTLDKLKEKLNLSGASRGLENLNTSANKVNLGGLSNAVDTVRSKFSALEIMGVTALANITNSAVNAAKRMVHELTIAPRMDGWKEYELTMNTIQTIMNSTGSTADEVKAKLKTLDDYADKTVYSTADMFNNIYKFTNAGIDLDTATKAMIGIANATADAGQGAQQASMAYYNLAQSLSTGYLTTIDYKSLNLANIVTKDMKQLFADTAIQAGTLKKKGNDLYQVGKKTYNLQQLFTEGLSDQWATADVIMKVFGEYGDETTKLGNRAYKAATEVKTYTAMMESLKASAGTGWKRTWELIFGDLEPAKKFWTSINEFIGGIISGMAEFRNKILEGALGKSFKTMSQNLSNVIKPVKSAVESVSKATEKLKDVNALATEVIRGNWGNGKKRLDELTKAGYNYYAVQNKVNEKLGNSFRYSEKVVESQNELLKTQNKQSDAQEEMAQTTEYTLEQLAEMSEAQLKDLKLKDEEIKALKDLKKYSDMTGLSMQDFLDKSGEIDGRWLLINSFKNLGKVILDTAKIFKKAWNDIFHPNKTDEEILAEKSELLFKIIAGIHKLTTHLPKLRDENGELTDTGDKLLRTFKGIVAIIDLFVSITRGGFKLVLSVIKAVLKAFDMDLLSFTAALGDAAVKLRDWVKESLFVNVILKGLLPWITKTVKAIKDWVKNNELINNGIKKFKDGLKNMSDAIKNWFKGLKETDNVGKYIIDGLVNGLKKGFNTVVSVIVGVAKLLIDAFCKVLGIHSPSKEFEEMGGHIISGLANGLKGGLSSIGDVLKSIGKFIIDMFKSLDLGDVLLFSGIIALAKIIKGLGDVLGSAISGVGSIISAATNVLEGVAKMFYSIGNMFDAWTKKIKYESLSKLIKSVTLLLAVIAIAVYKLSEIEPDKLRNAVLAIAAIAGIVAGLTFLLSKIDEVRTDSKVLLGMLGISASLYLMTVALCKLGEIPADRMDNVVIGLIAIIGGIAAMLLILSKVFKQTDSFKIGAFTKTVLGISASLVLMALAFKVMSILKTKDIIKGIAFVAGFLVFMAALVKITKTDYKTGVAKIGGTLLAVTVSMLLMVAVIKLISKLSLGEVLKGIAFMGAFLGFMKLLIMITKSTTPSEITKLGGTILAISASMIILALTMKLLASMDVKALAKGVIGVTLLLSMVIILMNIVRETGKDAPKIAGTIFSLSIAIAMLGLTALLLGSIKTEKLAKGIVAVALLGAIMAALLYLCKGSEKVIGGVIGLAAAMLVMSLSLATLAKIEPDKLKGAIASMAAMAAILVILVHATKNASKSAGSLLVIAGVMVVLAWVLSMMSKIPTDQALKSAAALGILIVALVGTLALLGKVSGVTKQALIGMLGMLGIIALLALVVGVLSKMEKMPNAAKNALVLSAFMGVLVIVLLLTSAVGSIYAATGGLAATGLLGMVAIIGMLYLIIGALALMAKVDNAMSNLTALGDFLKMLTDILIRLAIIGPFALIGVTALTSLTGLMTAMGVFAVAVGVLMTKFPAVEKFLDKGLSTLIKLANGLGSMIGAFIKGALLTISSSLPTLGKDLSQFMINALPFISGAKLIDKKVVSGITSLSGAILALTAANLINGITSILPFVGSLADLGTELSKFMINALPFIATSLLIDPKSVEGVKALAETILILTAADILDGINIFGKTPLEKFSEQLPVLAEGLKNFVSSLGPLSSDQVEAAANAANIIHTLAKAAKEIPNSGGLLGALVGNNDMGEWSKQLPVMGKGIADFVNTMTEAKITTDSVKVAETAADIIKKLAEVAKEIPNTGGLLATLIGDNNLDTFASQLPSVGEGISGFVTKLRDAKLTESDVAIATNAAEVVKSLATAADTIPNTGGLLAELIGDNNLTKFAEELPKVGTGIAGFVSKLGTFDDKKLKTVTAATDAIEVVANMSQNYKKSKDKKDFESFGDGLVTLAGKISSFATEMSKVSADSITTATDTIQKILDFIQNISATDTTVLTSFGDALKNTAVNGVKAFINQLTGTGTKADAKTASEKLISFFVTGITKEVVEVVKLFDEMAKNAVAATITTEILNSATTAGKDLAQGFANGILANSKTVAAAGTTIGNEALIAAKAAIDSNSPSKEAMKIGNYFGQGLVIGIDEYASNSYDAGYSIADRAKAGLSKAISKVSALISSGIDDQPTIRPVLDLSDVESGASYLNTMFNNGPSIGVTSNLSAISTGVNSRNQNGSNDDVISAINSLRSDLGNVSGNTYNINGITYDDGSNITNAVKDLIRAANIERRI